jgi:hypothetical protein
MTRSRFVDRLVVGVVAVALVACCVAGCASDHRTQTIIGGRPVTYRSPTEKDVSLKVINQDEATFAAGRFEFKMDRARVTWGQGQTLALPNDWRRVDFIDEETHVVVKVDGKAYGKIRPAA